MPELIVIRDPILLHNRYSVRAEVGQSVRDLWPQGVDTRNVRIIHNGAVVQDNTAFLDAFRFGEHDQVILRVQPGFGIGEAIFLGGAAAFSAGVSVGASIAAIVTNIAIAIAVSIGISALVRALLPTPKAESRRGDTESQTYGWDGIQNTTANGTPIPILYGRHRMGGHILSSFTKAKSDGKNELYVQVGLGAGPVSAINGKVVDADDLTGATIGDALKINDNPASSFSSLSVSYRRGSWDQAVVPGFADAIVQIAQNTEITASTYSYTTSDDCQAVELLLRCPSGLYRMNNKGAFLQYEVQHRVCYRQQGAASYGAWQTISLSAQTRSAYNYAYRIEFGAACTYELQIERVTAVDGTFEVSSTYLIGVQEINYDDVAYNGIATVSLKAIASEELSGAMPTITSLVHGKKCVVYHPDDDFGEDTQQTIAADGEALWGWNAANMAGASSIATHAWSLRTLSVLHNTTSTAWNGSTASGPFCYKEVTGDFDVSVRGVIAGGVTSVMTMLLVQSPTDTTDWLYVGSWHDGTTQRWYFRHATNGVNTLSDYGTSSDSYFRIVRSGSTFTCYTSADGTTWTQRAQVTRADLPTTLRVGCASSTPSNTAGTHRSLFSGFTFADSTAYSIECTRNPAWIIYDVLTDTHYGIGAHLDPTQINLASFINFADYCNAPVTNGASDYHRRHCMDVVIDSASSAWDRVQELARCARASIVMQADSIRAVFQAPATAVQLFTIGNIKRGSFALSYQSPKTSANAWEIQFLNEASDYEQDYESYVDPDVDAGEPYRCQTTPMWGITRRAHALREARFLARANRLLTAMCAFETSIEALACEPGDRIEIQFDTPAWGQGGRVVSGSNNTVAFDAPVTIAAGSTYEVMVRHANDAIETRIVSTSAGTYTSVMIGPDWTAIPAAGDVFSFGLQAISTRPFLITSIERTSDLECKIECVEYDAQLYDDTITDLGEITYTTLPNPNKIPGDVENLVVTERAQIEKDGTIKNVIDVTYSLPIDAAAAEVWWRESDKTAWQYVGTSKAGVYTIDSGVVYGTTYHVAVAAVSPWGLHKSADLCPYATIAIQGRTTAPPDVTGLAVTRVGNSLHMTWTAVDCPDLAGYEVRYGVSSWTAAQLLATGISGTEYDTVSFSPGSQYFLIKAYNTSGIYSATAGYVNPTIDGRIAENLVIERDETTAGWSGTKTQMTVDGSYLDLHAGQVTGSYETPELDCAAVVRSIVACLVSTSQVDLGVTWAGSTFTWGSATAGATSWSGSSTDHLTVSLEFRYGNTSGALCAYQPFVPGEYTARYYQFRVTVTVDSAAYSATIERMLMSIDVPDYVLSGRAISLGTGLITITWTDYGPGFNVTPKVVAIASGGGAGDMIEIYSVSSTQMQVRYWNGAGTNVAGYMNFMAQGY